MSKEDISLFRPNPPGWRSWPGVRIAQRVFWRVRIAAGFPDRNDHETLFRLSQIPEADVQHAPFVAHLPWGEFEYFSIANVRSQFRDIFLRRQYAFVSEDPVPVIVDCGGNVGLSAIWFRRKFPNCPLTVYEADPVLGEVLRRNLARAGYPDVDVRIAAAWIVDGTTRFRRGGADEGAIADDGMMTVRSVSLARELPDRVDLLKLDIEGAEFAVLRDLCESRAIERVRRLIAEFHVRREQSGEFLSLLTALQEIGFQVVLGSAVPWQRNGFSQEDWEFESQGSGDTLVEIYASRR